MILCEHNETALPVFPGGMLSLTDGTADLRLIEVFRLEAETPEEDIDATLPAVREVAGVPVGRMIFCHATQMLATAGGSRQKQKLPASEPTGSFPT